MIFRIRNSLRSWMIVYIAFAAAIAVGERPTEDMETDQVAQQAASLVIAVPMLREDI